MKINSNSRAAGSRWGMRFLRYINGLPKSGKETRGISSLDFLPLLSHRRWRPIPAHHHHNQIVTTTRQCESVARFQPAGPGPGQGAAAVRTRADDALIFPGGAALMRVAKTATHAVNLRIAWLRACDFLATAVYIKYVKTAIRIRESRLREIPVMDNCLKFGGGLPQC